MSAIRLTRRNMLGVAAASVASGLTKTSADQGKVANHLACTFFPQAQVRVHPDLAGRDRVLEIEPHPEVRPHLGVRP